MSSADRFLSGRDKLTYGRAKIAAAFVSDPNRDDEPDYIVKLISKVTTVNLETQKMIATFPVLTKLARVQKSRDQRSEKGKIEQGTARSTSER
jgi:hypothetical protein